MALPDLTGQNIQDTYQRLVQVDATGSFTDGTGSNLPISIEGDNVRVTGDVIANQYVVSSSVTNITTQTLSGSTQFGNSADDTHTFTGNITASSNISSSGQINADKIRAGEYAGSAIFDIAAGAGGIDTDGAMSCTGFSNSSTSTFGGRIDIVGASSYVQTPSYVSASQLISSGHITASGDISQSTGRLFTNHIELVGNNNFHGGDIGLPIQANHVQITDPNNGPIAAQALHSRLTVDGDITANSHITASGHLSSSGNIFAAQHYAAAVQPRPTAGSVGFGTLAISSQDYYMTIGHHTEPAPLTINSNITASKNISGSSNSIISSGTGSFNRLRGDSSYATGLEVNGYITATDISASGNISASGEVKADTMTAVDNIMITTTGPANAITLDKDYGIQLTGTAGNITASGNISASGNLIGNDIHLNGTVGLLSQTNQLQISSPAGSELSQVYFKTAQVAIGSANFKGSLNVGTNGLNVERHISASGNISASGHISASGARITGSIHTNRIVNADDQHLATHNDTYLDFAGTNNIELVAAGRTNVDVGYSWVNINDGANDVDFRVKGASDNQLIYANAGDDKVGIGVTSPQSKLHVAGDITASGKIETAGNLRINRSNHTYRLGEAGGSGNLVLDNGDENNFPNFNVFANETTFHDGNVQIDGNTTLGDNTGLFFTRIRGNVTASGNISSSGDIIASDGTIFANKVKSPILEDDATTNNYIQFLGGTHKTNFVNGGTTTAVFQNTYIGLNRNITASADISSSGLISAANFHVPGQGRISFDNTDTDDQFIKGLDNSIIIDGDDLLRLRADHSIDFEDGSNNAQVSIDGNHGHITASANISASGTVTSMYREYVNDTFVNESSGDIITIGTGPGGVTGDIVAGRVYCMDSSQQWELVDANASATSTGMLGIAIRDSEATFLLKGVMYHANFGTGGATGNPMYISEDAGLITGTAPTTTGAYVRIVGYQIDFSSRGIFFDPDKTWVELT